MDDHDLAKAWLRHIPLLTDVKADRFADAQVQLGYGRVDPCTLTCEQVCEISHTVKVWESMGAYS